METKTHIAASHYRAGNIRAALAIYKTFKIGLSEDERRAIQIYHECETGRSAFYTSIGVDVQAQKQLAQSVIAEKFLK